MSIRLVNLDVQKIMSNHNMNATGELFLSSEIKRVSDPYVPFDTGHLKNSAIPEVGKLTYLGPYARRQWYEHKGDGMRGRQWCERAMIDRGDEVTKTVAKFCGGKPK